MSSIDRLAAKIRTHIWLRDRAVASLAGPMEIDERNRAIRSFLRLYQMTQAPMDTVLTVEWERQQA